MKNSELSKKIKALRGRKGYSQDELSQVSQLSLRTIQRIESGETEPRGDTVKRLANALGVTPDELIDWTEQEDNSYLAIMNLSALSFIAFPLLGVIIPFALWVLKKDKIRYVSDIGKSLINFQITWCITIFIVYILIFTGVVGSFSRMFGREGIGGIGGMELGLLGIFALYAFNVILVLFNTFRSIKTMKVLYRPAIPFLR